jgi:isopentenyl-diphosphate delta-isomerase
VELMRVDTEQQQVFEPVATLGENPSDMVDYINHIVEAERDVRCHEYIVSGGIKSFVDGYYLINKLNRPAIYGQASSFLKYARQDFDSLLRYVEYQLKGLKLAYQYLTIRS